MPVLNLSRLWVNRMDTGEGISGASARDRGTSYSMDGNVRTYANGRRRAVAVAGEKGDVSRTMLAVDLTTVETLRSWMGSNVLMRDHRGNRWFGVFYGIEIGEYMRTDLYTVGITLQTTTTVEGV